MRMSDSETETTEQVVEALPIEEAAHADPHDLGLELPADKDEAIQLLLDELQVAREEAGSYLGDLKRVAADFDNYRKRTTRDSATTLERATEKVVHGLMPVLDSFDAALAAEPRTDTERQLYSGMLNTRELLLGALEKEGLEVIPTIGEDFDPEIHEPVGAPESPGRLIVAEELRRGYRLRGKVLRAALVALETQS
jgi:molecular chaperone GrpE